MATQFLPDLPGLGISIKRTPKWDGLLVQTAASGIESRMQQWSAPKWSWELPINYLHVQAGGVFFAEFQTLIGFYNSTFGGLTSFAFRDQNDNTTTSEPIGTGNGTTSAFQLQRTLNGSVEPIYIVDTRGSATYGPYTRPAAITPKAYINGSLASATFANDTGIVTFSSPPGGGTALTADFSYGFRVRFEETSMDFELLFSKIYQAQSVKLLQCRT